MTEYDSGSSSDSGSNSSSSSDSSSSDSPSGQGGPDFSYAVQSLIENALDPGTPTRSSTASTPAEQRAALLNPAIQALFQTSGPVQDQRSLVRRIVEAERWFVPTAPDGSFERVRVADEGARRAFRVPLTAAPKQRRPARTAPIPSTVVQVFTDDPGRPARQLSGRTLVRALPADTAGVLFLRGTEPTVGLHRDDLPLLTQIADALDLEQVLSEPAPGQVPALQASRWYVPANNQALRPTPPGWGDPTVYIYTHPDRAEAKPEPMIELDGRTLWKQLAARGDFVEICVNPMQPVGVGERALNGLSLAPNVARGLSRGVDPRPGAEPLPARTLAEALLWLDLAGFPWKDREIAAVPGVDTSTDSNATLIQVRTTDTSDWRLVGKSYQSAARRPTVSPIFALARADGLPASLPAPVPPAYLLFRGKYLNQDVTSLTSDAIDLGGGQTEILCAGLLAEKLYDQDRWAPRGWLVSKQARLRAAQLAGWAHELLKLIPPGADRLPRSAILSVHGAGFLRNRSEFRDRDWIEQQHQRHTRSATRRFNFR